MKTDMCLELNNFGPISNAKIDINKINIIGGKNATGKSTASKILYCFLKSTSFNRQEMTIDNLKDMVSSFENNIKFMNSELADNRHKFSQNILNNKKIKMIPDYDLSIKKSTLEDYKNFLDMFYQFKTDCLSYLSNYESEFKNAELPEEFSLDDKSQATLLLYHIFGLKVRITEIEEVIKIINENSIGIYESFMRTYINSEFNNFSRIWELDNSESENLKDSYVKLIKNDDLYLKIIFNLEKNKYNYRDWNTINNIFYLDSYSIFDTKEFYNGLYSSKHSEDLLNSLTSPDESKEFFDNVINKDINKVEKKLIEKSNEKVIFDGNQFLFIDNNKEFTMNNTSSGKKQSHVLDMLLANRQLKPDSFIIIDEPEVNLHPEAQVEYAEKITILAKYLNINFYINTHSPLFIEAIDACSEYYDLEDDTNYYLTSECDDGKYTFKKIDQPNLNILYDDLGDPYNLIDSIRIRKRYKSE